MSTLTLETLAEAKKLPAEFLRSLGVEDMPSGKIPGVLIGYLDENGKQHSRVRLRAAQFRDPHDDGKARTAPSSSCARGSIRDT